MRKGGGKTSSGGTKLVQKWLPKPGTKAVAPEAATEPTGVAEVITSPILLGKETGPAYGKMQMLNYFGLLTKRKGGDLARPTLEKQISLAERPEEADAPKTDARKALRDQKKEKLSRKSSTLSSLDDADGEEYAYMPDTTSQRISLTQELPMAAQPSEGGTPYPADPFLQMYLNSMYAPMAATMYSGGGIPGYTTVMLRNIPNRYSRDMLHERLSKNYRGQFDFVYLPIDFNSKCNVGYAFINFRTPAAAASFTSDFHGKKTKTVLPGFSSNKICEVTYARVQGRDANMENLRDEKFIDKLNERPEWQPVFYDERGLEIPFQKTLGTAGKRRSRADTQPTPNAAMMGAAGFSPPMYPGTPLGTPAGMSPMMFPGFGVGAPPAMLLPAGPQEMALAGVLPNATSSTMHMLRNVPITMTRSQLVAALNKEFKGAYDFLFLLGDDAGEVSRGFAFINFKQAKKAQEFAKAFGGVAPKDCLGCGEEGAKACEVVAARLGSIEKNIERLRQSIGKSKDAKNRSAWYPTLLGEAGEELPYPMPGPGEKVFDSRELEKKMKQEGKAAAKGAGKAEAKGKGEGWGARGGKGGLPPPPLTPAQGGYCFPGYQTGAYSYAMPQVNPAYAAAMAQAAHAHSRALAAHYAGQQQMAGRGGLRSPLAAAVARPSLPLDAEGPARQEALKALKTQIEFYFSVDNLCKDLFLRSHMNPEGWTPIELIAAFPKVKKTGAVEADIVEGLNNSTVLEVDPMTRYIRLRDPELRQIFAEVPNEYRQSVTPSNKKNKKGST